LNEDESVTNLIAAMRGSRKQREGKDWPKPQKRSDKAPAMVNKCLAEQTRKILGKHYASKYRVR